MSGSRRGILIVLPLVAVAIAGWLLFIAPKRQEASDLEADAAALQRELDAQEQLAIAADEARQDFPTAYRRLVVLGKAAPEDDDTASFLVELERIAASADVEFIALTAQEGEVATAPPPPAEPQTPADTAAQDEQRVENVEQGEPPVPAPAPATEAQAALLPIGAAIGPAGLPVMRYSLTFDGKFFQLADFLAGIDRMVRSREDGRVGVRGRLVTVDGFVLSPADVTTQLADAADGTASARNPELSADFTITTYVSPAEEGVVAGASPTGPAPVTEAQPAATAPPPGGSTTASATTP